MTTEQKRNLLAKYRAIVVPTLNNHPAVICGIKEDFAVVGTINGPALRAEFSWQTVARVLAAGGAFKL